MDISQILNKCDHTLLAQTATWEEKAAMTARIAKILFIIVSVKIYFFYLTVQKSDTILKRN